MDQVNFFKGSLPQILLGLFLNTFFQIIQIYMKKLVEKPFRDCLRICTSNRMVSSAINNKFDKR